MSITSRHRRYLTRSRSPTPNPSTDDNLKLGPSAGTALHPLHEAFTSSGAPIPLPNDPSGLYSILITDQDLAITKKKYVKVTGSSEIDIEPDRINFVIQIKSVKPDIRDARASVRKREDYIVNVLKKHLIPESNYVISEFVEKIPKIRPPPNDGDYDADEYVNLNNNEGNLLHEQAGNTTAAAPAAAGPSNTKIPIQHFESFKLTKEINVNIDNLMKYLQVFSICNEKLDDQVLISQPIIKFSTNLLQSSTQKAIRGAMINSQAKAIELVGNYKHHHDGSSGGGTHLTLGALIYSSEDSLTIQNMKEYEKTSSYFETFKWKRFNKRITCQITSAFEIHARSKKII